MTEITEAKDVTPTTTSSTKEASNQVVKLASTEDTAKLPRRSSKSSGTSNAALDPSKYLNLMELSPSPTVPARTDDGSIQENPLTTSTTTTSNEDPIGASKSTSQAEHEAQLGRVNQLEPNNDDYDVDIEMVSLDLQSKDRDLGKHTIPVKGKEKDLVDSVAGSRKVNVRFEIHGYSSHKPDKSHGKMKELDYGSRRLSQGRGRLSSSESRKPSRKRHRSDKVSKLMSSDDDDYNSDHSEDFCHSAPSSPPADNIQDEATSASDQSTANASSSDEEFTSSSKEFFKASRKRQLKDSSQYNHKKVNRRKDARKLSGKLSSKNVTKQTIHQMMKLGKAFWRLTCRGLRGSL
ncbi:hypothetical protein BC829DRAFT_442775 [Chytridium lagenaria]|nr:hypothetical protein BC829DRAFT_442775 [Chytridium lagenaria]